MKINLSLYFPQRFFSGFYVCIYGGWTSSHSRLWGEECNRKTVEEAARQKTPAGIESEITAAHCLMLHNIMTHKALNAWISPSVCVNQQNCGNLFDEWWNVLRTKQRVQTPLALLFYCVRKYVWCFIVQSLKLDNKCRNAIVQEKNISLLWFRTVVAPPTGQSFVFSCTDIHGFQKMNPTDRLIPGLLLGSWGRIKK